MEGSSRSYNGRAPAEEGAGATPSAACAVDQIKWMGRLIECVASSALIFQKERKRGGPASPVHCFERVVAITFVGICRLPQKEYAVETETEM